MTLQNYRILIVDDNPTFIKTLSFLIQDVLASRVVKLDVARNGIEALDKVFNGDPYNIIFMDVNMPLMDGITATKLINREFYRGTKIIAVSFNRDLQTISEMVFSGAVDYIYKDDLTVEMLEKVFDIKHL